MVNMQMILIVVIAVVVLYLLMNNNSNDKFTHKRNKCEKMMKECSEMGAMKGLPRSEIAKRCAIGCFDVCSSEGRTCEETYAILVDSSDPDILDWDVCSKSKSLGCQWNCLVQGLGDECMEGCPSVSENFKDLGLVPNRDFDKVEIFKEYHPPYTHPFRLIKEPTQPSHPSILSAVDVPPPQTMKDGGCMFPISDIKKYGPIRYKHICTGKCNSGCNQSIAAYEQGQAPCTDANERVWVYFCNESGEGFNPDTDPENKGCNVCVNFPEDSEDRRTCMHVCCGYIGQTQGPEAHTNCMVKWDDQLRKGKGPWTKGEY